MKEEEKEYLRKILKEEFKKYTTNPLITLGYCRKIISIAEHNGLGYDFIKELKERFLDTFKTEYKSK